LKQVLSTCYLSTTIFFFFQLSLWSLDANSSLGIAEFGGREDFHMGFKKKKKKKYDIVLQCL